MIIQKRSPPVRMFAIVTRLVVGIGRDGGSVLCVVCGVIWWCYSEIYLRGVVFLF